MREMLIALVEELGLNYETHDSHGFYLDVQVGGRWLMVDPTPESIWTKDKLGRRERLVKRYAKGTVIVRNLYEHHYDRPTQIGPDFNINTPAGFSMLRSFLADTERLRRMHSRSSLHDDAVTLLGELAS